MESDTSTDSELEELIKSADNLLSSASLMIIQLKIPTSDELDRKKIWLDTKLSAEFSVFDLDTVFSSLKEAAISRPAEQSWFSFIRWVFWGSSPKN